MSEIRIRIGLGVLCVSSSVIPALLALTGSVFGFFSVVGQVQYPSWFLAVWEIIGFLLSLTFFLKIIFYLKMADDDNVTPLILGMLIGTVVYIICLANVRPDILFWLILPVFCVMIYPDCMLGLSIASGGDNLEEEQSISKSREISTCAICKAPGIHEICLICEEKYQAERHKVRAQILRAKRAGTPATLTLPEWIDTLNSLNWKCVYCQIAPYTVMEHFIPVTQGGGTTKENCSPSCVSCNSIKGDKHPDRITPKFKSGRRS